MNRVKVLVANRSEIACRVFQTCREMGLKTVAVMAPGDEQSRHVTYADEVQEVSSYLDISSILEAAHRSNANLIHPGYGFLSERPAFAKAVEMAGRIFIGPRPETMELMGEKIAAKNLATRVGVPTLPWAKVAVGSDIKSVANQVGYPLLLKASAGGGGKGMRRVNRHEDLIKSAESASAEAVSFFGDGTLFMERLIDRARHIEVQVFGDGQGGGIHLNERECSLQRRHQKIWEEATAPHLSVKIKEGLFDSALQLVKAIRYRNAGTLEFLLDEGGNYYFLEMNTRLQVEHPVTEAVTGVDLVWAQIAQAQSQSPVLTQCPSPRGHAIEVRLYAEDPSQGFIPTPGRIGCLRWPTGAGIRIESGIEEGQAVGTQFDSMLAKVIVHAQSRAHALSRLQFALEETVILGVGTNQNYLRALIDHPRVREGKVSTEFLETEFTPFEFVPSEEDLDLLRASQGIVGHPIQSYEKSEHPSPWSAFR